MKKILLILLGLFITATAYATPYQCYNTYSGQNCGTDYVMLGLNCGAATDPGDPTASSVASWDAYCDALTHGSGVNCLSTAFNAAYNAAVCRCDTGWSGSACDVCASGYILIGGSCVAFSTHSLIYDDDTTSGSPTPDTYMVTVNPTTGADYDIITGRADSYDLENQSGVDVLRINNIGAISLGPVKQDPTVVPAGPSIFTDSGLEAWTTPTDLTNWDELLFSASTVTQESTIVHSGSYAAKLTTDGTGPAVLYQLQSGLTPSDSYVASAWERWDTAGVGFVVVLNGTVAGATQIWKFSGVGANSWQTYTGAEVMDTDYQYSFTIDGTYQQYTTSTFTVPANGTLAIGYVIQSSGLAQSIYIDDLSLNTPGGSTPAPLITAIDISNPSDYSKMTASDYLLKISSTGGTDNIYLFIDGLGEITNFVTSPILGLGESLYGHNTELDGNAADNPTSFIGGYISTYNANGSTSTTQGAFISSGDWTTDYMATNKELNITTVRTSAGNGYDVRLRGGGAFGSGPSTGGDVYLVGGYGVSSSNGDIILAYDSGNVVGNVGIGTNSPESQLEVQADEANPAILTLDADQGDEIYDTWQIQAEDSPNYLVFNNAGNDKLWINQSGFIGNGSAPQAQVHANANVISGEYVNEVASTMIDGNNNTASVIAQTPTSSASILAFPAVFSGTVSGGGSYSHFQSRAALWAGVYINQSDPGLSQSTSGLDIVSRTGDIRFFAGGAATTNITGSVSNSGLWGFGTSPTAGVRVKVNEGDLYVGGTYGSDLQIDSASVVQFAGGTGMSISNNVIYLQDDNSFTVQLDGGGNLLLATDEDATTYYENEWVLRNSTYSGLSGSDFNSPYYSMQGGWKKDSEASGSATGGSSTTLVDTSKTWTINKYANTYSSAQCVVNISTGSCAGCRGNVQSNTVDTLTVASWYSCGGCADPTGMTYDMDCMFYPRSSTYLVGATDPYIEFKVSPTGYDEDSGDLVEAMRIYDDKLYLPESLLVNVDNFTYTPNALSRIQKDAVLTAIEYFRSGLVVESAADGTYQGASIIGYGKTSSAQAGIGVKGVATVAASSDTTTAHGGYFSSTATHSGGSNIGATFEASGSSIANWGIYVLTGNSHLGSDIEHTGLTMNASQGTTTNIVAANGITSAQNINSNLRIQCNGAGNCDLSTDPQIADGLDGQVLEIECQNDTKTVQFDDGAGLVLQGGVSFTCGQYDVIKFVYNANADLWIEHYRSDN